MNPTDPTVHPDSTAPETPPPPTTKTPKFFYVLGVLAVLVVAAIIIVPTITVDTSMTPRSGDFHDLIIICQTRIGYECDHPDGMPPEALTDVYAFAAELARNENRPYSSCWFSRVEFPDEPINLRDPHPRFIIDPTTKLIDPKFQGAPLAVAVALLPKIFTLPPNTPIAWTRGLQPDGTWRKDSPYGGKGGSVFFVGADCRYFKGSIAGHFVKFGTAEPTSNLLEALPPGTRIGEYVPPPPPSPPPR